MKHVYSICLIKQEQKAGALELETLFSTYYPEEIEEIKKMLLEYDAGFRRQAQGKNVRPVVVTHVDAAEHEKWVSSPGRNGLASKPAKRGQVFPSATAASQYIGCRHNEVAQWLSRQRTEGEATIRGVTFAYQQPQEKDVKK